MLWFRGRERLLVGLSVGVVNPVPCGAWLFPGVEQGSSLVNDVPVDTMDEDSKGSSNVDDVKDGLFMVETAASGDVRMQWFKGLEELLTAVSENPACLFPDVE